MRALTAQASLSSLVGHLPRKWDTFPALHATDKGYRHMPNGNGRAKRPTSVLRLLQRLPNAHGGQKRQSRLMLFQTWPLRSGQRRGSSSTCVSSTGNSSFTAIAEAAWAESVRYLRRCSTDAKLES
jgi:hypothetical protein